jgi:U3 small nucleolar RNA-associated protein 14
MRAEYDRVKERMSLKHKNTGKWAKSQIRLLAKQRAGGSEITDAQKQTRQAIHDSATLNQKLSQKMGSMGGGGGGGGGDDSDEEEEEEEEESEEDSDLDPATADQRRIDKLKEQLKALKAEEDQDDSKDAKGVMGLKFMQRSVDRKREETQRMMQELEEELEDAAAVNSDGEVVERPTKAVVPAVTGKRAFSGSNHRAGVEGGDEKRVKMMPNGMATLRVGMSTGTSISMNQPIDVGAAAKPRFDVAEWSDDGDAADVSGVASAKALKGIMKGPGATLKSTSTAKVLQDDEPKDNGKRKVEEEDEDEDEDEDSEDDEDNSEDDEESEGENPWANSSTQRSNKTAGRAALDKKTGKTQGGAKGAAAVLNMTDVRLMDASDRKRKGFDLLGDGVEGGPKGKKGKSGKGKENKAVTFGDGGVEDSQEKLVKAAFSLAGDEEKLFLAEKAAEVEATLPKFSDTSVPGWGTWGGKGAALESRPVTKAKLRIKQKIERKAKELAAARPDSHLDKVVISAKRDTKVLKYMVPSLPYPYTSVEQFDRAQRTPIGSEWNPISTFQESVKPAIITKPGVIINPIEFNPAVGKKKGRDKTKKKHKKKAN